MKYKLSIMNPIGEPLFSAAGILANQKITTIKAIRHVTGCSLKQAKEWTEDLQSHLEVTIQGVGTLATKDGISVLEALGFAVRGIPSATDSYLKQAAIAALEENDVQLSIRILELMQ